jgi:hypothetical protein
MGRILDLGVTTEQGRDIYEHTRPQGACVPGWGKPRHALPPISTVQINPTGSTVSQPSDSTTVRTTENSLPIAAAGKGRGEL